MRLDPSKWYFQTYVFLIAFLWVGPLALILVWINPRYNMATKVVITVISMIISYFMIVFLAKSTESIYKYYNEVLKMTK